MRFTSQTGRRHDGTLDQRAVYPADLIQVGVHCASTMWLACADCGGWPPGLPQLKGTYVHYDTEVMVAALALEAHGPARW